MSGSAIGFGVVTAGSMNTGEGTTTMCTEIDYRMGRLMAEAERERLTRPQAGIRHHLGHVLIALGRAIHGPETVGRPALRPR